MKCIFVKQVVFAVISKLESRIVKFHWYLKFGVITLFIKVSWVKHNENNNHFNLIN